MQVQTSQFKTLPQVGDKYQGRTIASVSYSSKAGLFLTFEEDAGTSLYNDLRENVENVTTDENGETWGEVYLPNVSTKYEARRFAGLLSGLQKQGLYKVVDGEFFGLVKF